MKEIIKAIDFLKKNDPVIMDLIIKYGDCKLKASENYFSDLISTIISQQLSSKVYLVLEKRLFEKLKNKIEPDNVIALKDEEYRTCGISQSKTKYIKNVAEYFKNNPNFFKNIKKLTDEEIVKGLTSIKGIGSWSAQMFLIFNLRRLDVLPINDGGIRSAIKKQYKLKTDATDKQILKIAKNWGDYSTIASWYLWRSLDNK